MERRIEDNNHGEQSDYSETSLGTSLGLLSNRITESLMLDPAHLVQARPYDRFRKFIFLAHSYLHLSCR